MDESGRRLAKDEVHLSESHDVGLVPQLMANVTLHITRDRGNRSGPCTTSSSSGSGI